jgi:hypothetical protein
MKKNFLVVLISMLVLGGLVAASAAAAPFPIFWTDKTETELLRSVTATPQNQPDALEFVNNPPMEITWGKQPIIFCHEVEFGTTVVVNGGAIETKLALPFGVAEGDECLQSTEEGLIMVRTYFDTTAKGVVPATITITGGPPFVATIHKLKLSQNKAGLFCTVNLNGVKGEFFNSPGPFVEEGPPNLTLTVPPTPVKITGTGCPGTGVFQATFYLETMSTITDTAWIGP